MSKIAVLEMPMPETCGRCRLWHPIDQTLDNTRKGIEGYCYASSDVPSDKLRMRREHYRSRHQDCPLKLISSPTEDCEFPAPPLI
jgi:hypothetical protein